jgi:hypothetical protein
VTRRAPDHITRKGRVGEMAAWGIAVIAWAISYGTQVALARDHGIRGWNDWEAVGMGALADLASLSMMLLALDQAERGRSARLTWVLSLLAAGMMEWANVVYAGSDRVAVVLHAWPPFLAVVIVFVLVHVRRTNAAEGPRGDEVIDGQVHLPHDDQALPGRLAQLEAQLAALRTQPGRPELAPADAPALAAVVPASSLPAARATEDDAPATDPITGDGPDGDVEDVDDATSTAPSGRHQRDIDTAIDASSPGRDGDGKRDVPATVGRPPEDVPGGLVGVHDRDEEPVAGGPSEGGGADHDQVAAMTVEQARAAIVRLVRRARRSGRAVTRADVERLTGRKARQAQRLLRQAQAEVAANPSPARRPRVLGSQTGAPAAPAIAEEA